MHAWPDDGMQHAVGDRGVMLMTLLKFNDGLALGIVLNPSALLCR
jgi:hypothetical protein